MAVTSKRERALQIVLVVLGLGTFGANIYPLVNSLVALRPTGGTTAPMFYTINAALGVFLVRHTRVEVRRHLFASHSSSFLVHESARGCHPERSEGSAFQCQQQVPRYARVPRASLGMTCSRFL